jgi:hypothetical protein
MRSASAIGTARSETPDSMDVIARERWLHDGFRDVCGLRRIFSGVRRFYAISCRDGLKKARSRARSG